MYTQAMMWKGGGPCIRLINKTGIASVIGTVVTVSASVDNACVNIVENVPTPVGVIVEAGVPDGSPVWVCTGGAADVLFVGSTTRGNLARGFITGDVGYVAGSALAEAAPTAPFGTDKHFYEIGHVTESRTGPGLAKVILHFN